MGYQHLSSSILQWFSRGLPELLMDRNQLNRSNIHLIYSFNTINNKNSLVVIE